MSRPGRRVAGIAALILTVAAGTAAAGAVGARSAAASFTAKVLVNAGKITHPTSKGNVAISQPDDVAMLGGHIFVGFQNGVGSQGEPATTGNKDSTIVEFTLKGKKVAQWDVVGKCDGLGADPLIDRVVATVNEDGNSSLYVIAPAAGSTPVHYHYGKQPLPSHGGTDSVVLYQGMLLISASAPGTTGAGAPQAKYRAIYRVSLHAGSHVASLRTLFGDEAAARSVGSGKTVHLALTDPDSSETVPAYAHRFAGDFMLTSQGDEEQIFTAAAGGSHQTLSVLKLSASVDDTVWPSGPTGAIYTSDNGSDSIVKITGPFTRGSEIAAVTPCDENGAPSTCPAPGFPANYLGAVNTSTGAITRVTLHGFAVQPKGMLFAP
jgi:hypothetical protein